MTLLGTCPSVHFFDSSSLEADNNFCFLCLIPVIPYICQNETDFQKVHFLAAESTKKNPSRPFSFKISTNFTQLLHLFIQKNPQNISLPLHHPRRHRNLNFKLHQNYFFFPSLCAHFVIVVK